MAKQLEGVGRRPPRCEADPGRLAGPQEGRFAIRLPMDPTGMAGALAEAFNDIVQQVAESTDELDRISVAVGKEGKIDQRLSVGGRHRRMGRPASIPSIR